MNNDLEHFSEERLKNIIELADNPTMTALARIALAAKQAKPVGWISEYQLAMYQQSDDGHLVCHKSNVFIDGLKIYTTPPANSPAIPDGWVKCSDRMPKDCQTVLCHNELTLLSEIPFVADYVEGFEYRDGSKVCETGFYQGCDLTPVTFWKTLPAAPKPESE